MRFSTLAAGLPLVAAAPQGHSFKQTNTTGKTLILDQAPDVSQPYVLRKGSGRAVAVGAQVYRFSVTGNSSAGAFTLMQTNAPDSSELGVLPHIHKTHYENFYCTKGQIQLWAKTNDTDEQARVLTPGDYGAVPQDTVHTFQITDPDTQLTGVIQPGGFEQLFIAIANSEFNSSTGAEFVPAAVNGSSGSNPELISALEAFDVYAQLDFNPRRDLVNGSAGGDEDAWHTAANPLAPDAVTPNFIAKNRGPKYLNADGGVYHLVAPFATADQTASNFTMGTVTLSPLLSNQTANEANLTQPLAFQLEEGALNIAVDGYDAVTLIQGDVVFIPAHTPFTYNALAAFTKFLYVSGGGDGFDYQLLQRAVPWEYATYPVNAGFTVQ
ncbi:Quercetin-dioxygenase [Colletotrichum higginsianum IMI 349063]|uniref:Quercetin-dioxygenase n=2 Tax=Colletotrichum higginsianum TaxID=80884 RepID=A0A1B7YBF9_COLHI|nr:Quercetin-dioxygenase [Colletotrichum higginsianum IMI 349063]OBR09357.1 Quercetin-dioxygenase [Colletotrichum higginsianum IMI 349063]TIC96155.1 Quercetin 2,3-dioxygenase [Colletotrichum higginsianum]GJC96581.1 quercetin-dioxygenase [Colletotrichum higginsianum]